MSLHAALLRAGNNYVSISFWTMHVRRKMSMRSRSYIINSRGHYIYHARVACKAILVIGVLCRACPRGRGGGGLLLFCCDGSSSSIRSAGKGKTFALVLYWRAARVDPTLVICNGCPFRAGGWRQLLVPTALNIDRDEREPVFSETRMAAAPPSPSSHQLSHLLSVTFKLNAQ